LYSGSRLGLAQRIEPGESVHSGVAVDPNRGVSLGMREPTSRKSISMDWRSADGHADRLPALPTITLEARLIVAAQTQAIQPRATEIPPVERRGSREH
jgi:hypothetical protein